MVTIPGPTRRQIAKHEDELSALMRASLRRVAGRVADHMSGKTITAAAGGPSIDDIGPARMEWTQQVDSELLPYVGEVYDAGAAQVAAGLRDALPVGAGTTIPSVSSEDAEAYLAGKRNQLVGIGDDLWSEMRDQLTEGFQVGESIPELAARIRSAADLTQARADVVARTEVNAAANRGSIDQMRASGLQATKTWVATFDARTRPSHADANGQSVALNEPFDVGGESLDEPGDESASAENVANCRCTVTYEVGDEDITALVDESEAEPLTFSSLQDSKAFIGEQYGTWEAALTNPEYAGRAFYQSPGFELMNGLRRGSNLDAEAADLRRARKANGDFSKAIGKAPALDRPIVVYRGFSADQFGDLKPGMIVRDRGFVSTSLTSDVAPVGRATRPATMEITLPAGTRAGAGSSRELVLDSASMKIESITTVKGKMHVVATYVGSA